MVATSLPEKPARQNLRFLETVVKTPGLSSPCTMECGEGLLTAFGVGFTPHIQGQAGTDLRLRPHPVDTLLPLAIAPVAPLHRMRGGGQQLVIEKCEGLFQCGGKEFLQETLSGLTRVEQVQHIESRERVTTTHAEIMQAA